MEPLKYLDQYESKSTVVNYKSSLREFFKAVYGKRDPLEDLAQQYFSEKRNYEEDVENLLTSMHGRPPKSVRHRIAAVKVFMVENDVELNAKFWKRISGRIKGSRAWTEDRVPSAEEFRKILNHLPLSSKAMSLVLLSSGMRIGESLQLVPEDLELEADPARIKIKGSYTKTGNPRTTFISGEAKEVLLEWLKVRDQYLISSVSKTKLYEKDLNDPRVFPYCHANAYVMWNLGLKKSKFDKMDSSTNRHVIHPHVLRKFFRTKLASVIQVDVVEALMGHEGYLTEVYRKYSVEDLAKFYKQGEHSLQVFTDAGEVNSLRQEIEDRNKQLQTLAQGFSAENLELKSRISRLELEHIEFKKQLQKEVEELKQALKEMVK